MKDILSSLEPSVLVSAHELVKMNDFAKKIIDSFKSGVCIVEKNIASFAYVYELLKTTITGENLKIKHTVDDTGYGEIELSADEFIINKPKRFADIVALSDSYDICPKKNGQVYISMAFYDLIA